MFAHMLVRIAEGATSDLSDQPISESQTVEELQSAKSVRQECKILAQNALLAFVKAPSFVASDDIITEALKSAMP
jgi:hypothetical protein